MARKRTQTDADADPDRLVRQSAGVYRSADERFEVRQEGVGWFVLDSAQADELGQPLMQGPFATMALVRGALPAARKTRPLRRPVAKAPKRAIKKAEPPPPPPPTWIDKLTSRESTQVGKLIRALERDTVPKAEELVRRDREGLLPAVAAQLIEQRLETVVSELPPKEREAAKRLVRRVTEILSADGTTGGEGLPGWTVVEISAESGEPRNRRIVIR